MGVGVGGVLWVLVWMHVAALYTRKPYAHVQKHLYTHTYQLQVQYSQVVAVDYNQSALNDQSWCDMIGNSCPTKNHPTWWSNQAGVGLVVRVQWAVGLCEGGGVGGGGVVWCVILDV